MCQRKDLHPWAMRKCVAELGPRPTRNEDFDRLMLGHTLNQVVKLYWSDVKLVKNIIEDDKAHSPPGEALRAREGLLVKVPQAPLTHFINKSGSTGRNHNRAYARSFVKTSKLHITVKTCAATRFLLLGLLFYKNE
ncbi:hypothetical protein FVEG_13988 [Fusarium verticillioides 7600]|uniref:Uncharacterized protein n=1 Tax=Gibberella moniliformis (strain M3125 / FGSC 7600) TaxID=334819 RepID=A0A139YC18_GIBM7|nr:hypothetical protein FVEG_13988 [Fusarium verticillioides 7600]KYG13742.1 hypothetical protein FVEG_13988 [Fusarium verticillioides 7600]